MPDTTINHIINQNLNLLQSRGIETSRFEIKVLIAHILKTEPKYLIGSQQLNKQQIAELDKLIAQRLKHCPVDKIVGHKGFYKYDFIVNTDVLSPRSDTEIMVEHAIEILNKLNQPKILELGIGSGCIILSILADLPAVSGIGIDISEKALAIADINAEKLNIDEKRLVLLKAGWFDKDIMKKLMEYAPFDMILSNPPYIPDEEITLLDEEVKNYDPLIALNGGKDGLRDYLKINELAYNLLKSDGYLLLEAGDSSQLRKISLMAQSVGLNFVNILKDLTGKDRCIILKK